MQTTSINRLLDIVAALRGEGGCPWDCEQTLESVKQYLVEECYEVIDAIDSGDAAKHREELGDLLLHVVFHAQIRKEQGSFSFDDVVDHLCAKLVRRHPHVFGDMQVSGADEVLRNWEAIKASERQSVNDDLEAPGDPRSAVDGVPRHLPALYKAHQVQERAARVGFDWTEVGDVMAKVEEELQEVKKVLPHGNQHGRIKEEIGDLLFATVNLSRFQGVNAEEALNGSVDKFVRRFQEIEKSACADGRALSQCTLAEMDARWNAVKEKEDM